jgi:hypothetical protein
VRNESISSYSDSLFISEQVDIYIVSLDVLNVQQLRGETQERLAKEVLQ